MGDEVDAVIEKVLARKCQQKKEREEEKEFVQAILIADNFSDEFAPITNDIPFALLPVANRPLIDYTLDSLKLGGVDETFLFCCHHADKIKNHLKKYKSEDSYYMYGIMKVNLIVSESCCSLGDCLRDLDHKGLLRGNFVLTEPGVISNIEFRPIIKQHNASAAKDSLAAITVIHQVSGDENYKTEPHDVIAVNDADNQILFYRKIKRGERIKRLDFPVEIFLENSCVSLRHGLRDTHIAICSPSVLSLFSDNFDFQNKKAFIRSLFVATENVMIGNIYSHVLKGSQYGGVVTDWGSFWTISRELQRNRIFPLQICSQSNEIVGKDSIVSRNSVIGKNVTLSNSVIGEKVKIESDVTIINSIIMSGTKIDNGVSISDCVVGQNCWLKANCKVTADSIIGNNVIVEGGTTIENSLVQSQQPEDCDHKDILGKNAYRLRITDESDDEMDQHPTKRMSLLHIDDDIESSSDEESSTDSESDESSSTGLPVQEDTKLFFNEVIDSLTRGFEDQIQSENLILEINSSRYAYNVTLKEVNFHVVKAVLHMSFSLPTGPQYFAHFLRLLSYFSPVLKNYIRNESSMEDALQAIQDTAVTNEDSINNRWVMFVLKWFYDKEYISEEIILDWSKTLEQESKFYSMVKPFVDWLQEAEEATTSEEESD